jgi:hypothetical protein
MGPNTRGANVLRSTGASSRRRDVPAGDLDGGRTNQKQIDIQDLYQGNPPTGEVSIYKGEPVVVQAIRNWAAAPSGSSTSRKATARP